MSETLARLIAYLWWAGGFIVLALVFAERINDWWLVYLFSWAWITGGMGAEYFFPAPHHDKEATR